MSSWNTKSHVQRQSGQWGSKGHHDSRARGLDKTGRGTGAGLVLSVATSQHGHIQSQITQSTRWVGFFVKIPALPSSIWTQSLEIKKKGCFKLCTYCQPPPSGKTSPATIKMGKTGQLPRPGANSWNSVCHKWIAFNELNLLLTNPSMIF